MEWVLLAALVLLWLKLRSLQRQFEKRQREYRLLCDKLHKAGVLFPGLDLRRSAPPDWYGRPSGTKPLEFW